MNKLKMGNPMFALLLIIACSGSQIQEQKSVYICTGKYATKYHYIKSCKGLKNCKAEIKKISLDSAKTQKRTLCGFED